MTNGEGEGEMGLLDLEPPHSPRPSLISRDRILWAGDEALDWKGDIEVDAASRRR